MCDTIKQTYKNLIKSYEEPLIWKFMYDVENIIMIGKYEVPEPTFLIFYKKNNKYYIDIGYCYLYGGNGYGKFNSFWYDYKINLHIKLENNIYETVLDKLNDFFGFPFWYIILEENEYIEGCDFVKKKNKKIFYKI